MNVKDLREKYGLTQEELSVKTGIPRGRIAKWEQGLGKPKADDHEILRGFFETFIPEEKKNGEKVHRNRAVRPQEAQHAPDYRDDIIDLLKERVNSIERKQLLYLKTNNALLKTILQALGRIQAKADKRKLEEVLVELNNITELHLRSEKIDGN